MAQTTIKHLYEKMFEIREFGEPGYAVIKVNDPIDCVALKVISDNGRAIDLVLDEGGLIITPVLPE
jgi:hypothetical protein